MRIRNGLHPGFVVSSGQGHLRFPIEEFDPTPVLEASLDGKRGIGACDAPMTSGPFHPQADNLPTGTLNHSGSDLHALLAMLVFESAHGASERQALRRLSSPVGIVRHDWRWVAGNFGFRRPGPSVVRCGLPDATRRLDWFQLVGKGLGQRGFGSETQTERMDDKCNVVGDRDSRTAGGAEIEWSSCVPEEWPKPNISTDSAIGFSRLWFLDFVLLHPV